MILHRNVLGVDVAGDWIDVFDASNNRSIRVMNDNLETFATGLAPDAFVVLEATGGYERPLMDALEKAGLRHSRVNPRHVREFARATGHLAKTDRVDARVLAEMGSALDLRPTRPVDAGRRRLAELTARRQDIVSHITADTQRLAMAHDPFVRRDIGRLLGVLRGRRAAIEKEIARHIRSCEKLSTDAARLRTAPGVGQTIAAVLLARLPELGQLDRRAIASLAGLAPHACDSGHRRGKRHIWGGREDVRRVLYIAAFVASRRDPVLKAVRDRMQAAGKPAKVAILAIARKLLTILNAMIRDQRDYA
jgi:transposase